MIDCIDRTILRLTDSKGRTVYVGWVGACDAPGVVWSDIPAICAEFEEEMQRKKDRPFTVTDEILLELDYEIEYLRAKFGRQYTWLTNRGRLSINKCLSRSTSSSIKTRLVTQSHSFWRLAQ